MGFCPVCGVDIQKGQTFCDKHRKVSISVKPFDIRICSCGRFFGNNSWFVPNNVEESVIKIIKDHIKPRVSSCVLEEFIIPEKRNKKTFGKAIVSFEGEEFPVKFKVKNLLCDKCAKVGTNYFTAILQLRHPPKEALPFIQDFLEPYVERGVAINKVVNTPNGPDLYLTHKSIAKQCGEKLIRRFGGVVKVSEQLFSRNHQTSKNLYRLNVSVNFSAFTKNDVVLLDDRVVLVTGVGKQCTGRDINMDKKVIFVAGEEKSVLKKFKTEVCMVKPKLAVIHPETFQSVNPMNHINLLPKLKINEKVRVVCNKKEVYII